MRDPWPVESGVLSVVTFLKSHPNKPGDTHQHIAEEHLKRAQHTAGCQMF
jgi:LysM repeat protein